MNKTKHVIIHLLIIIGLILSSGCNIIEFFKSDKKEVKRTIDRIKVSINNDDWVTIRAKSTADFKWITSEGVTYKNSSAKKPTGFKRYRASISDLPDNRISFMMEINEVKKVTKEKYFTKITSRLKIRKGAGATDNIKWQSLYTWIKKGDEWFFSEVKDLQVKEGNQNLTYNTNPIPKKKKGKKKSRK